MRPQKGDFISSDKGEQILNGALSLLSQVGLLIPEAPVRDALQRSGILLEGNRVHIPASTALAYLDFLRQGEPAASVATPGLSGKIGIYANRYETLDRAETPLFTQATLVSHAQFCQACGARYGFAANVPGYAHDVPFALESLHKYMVSALWCDVADPEPSSLLSTRYLFDMAEVLGQPLTRLPVFPASPLSLAGSSVQALLEHHHRLQSAYVYAMPMLGITTPMEIAQGFAMGLAEVLGSACLLHQATGLRVDIRPNLIPFDLRALNPSFGSPEKFLLELAAADLYAYLLQTPLNYRSTNIHTMAKTCGVQSVFEKASLMSLGAAHGARYFYCLGALALDEVFSPLQLILDAEMMTQIGATLAPLPTEDLPDDFVAYAQAHLQHGFLNTDLTLDNYGIVRSAGLFDRSTYAQWTQGERRDILDRAAQTARDLMAVPATPKLPPEKAAALAGIYARATQDAESAPGT